MLPTSGFTVKDFWAAVMTDCPKELTASTAVFTLSSTPSASPYTKLKPSSFLNSLDGEAIPKNPAMLSQIS